MSFLVGSYWGAEHRIDFINLAVYLSPALGNDVPELILDNPERKSCSARLLDLSPMGVGLEPITTRYQLAFIGDARGDPNHKLQLVHRLRLLGFLIVSLAEFPPV